MKGVELSRLKRQQIPRRHSAPFLLTWAIKQHTMEQLLLFDKSIVLWQLIIASTQEYMYAWKLLGILVSYIFFSPLDPAGWGWGHLVYCRYTHTKEPRPHPILAIQHVHVYCWHRQELGSSPSHSGFSMCTLLIQTGIRFVPTPFWLFNVVCCKVGGLESYISIMSHASDVCCTP